MKDLVAYVDTKEAEILAFLERIVNIDSGTHDKAGVDQVGNILADKLQELGFEVEKVPQTQYGDHLIARKQGRGQRSILFIGHMDTVFPAGTAARRPFRVEGGRAYGPGVLDMKGGDVSLLFALEALKATGNPVYDDVTMTVIFNSDEEVLSPTSRSIFEVEAKRADTACVFEPARPGGEYVIRRKGVGKYYLTVHGRAAHAGAQPEQGRSAVEEMARKILAIHAMTDFKVGTTLNVGLVRGGERSNVVAETAYAEIDLRAPDMEEARRVDARLREIAAASTVPDTTAELTGGLVFPPMEQTPASRRLFEAVQAAGRELGLDLQGISTGGGSDGNHAAQFTPTIDGMGPKGSETHSDREFIEVASMSERTKVTTLFLASWPRVIGDIKG
jgi:glutamate carboxypeptidase